ncbi:MAG: maleylpyruvate isomerase N-terminal domain-containing protein [Nakamurella sp.]
MGTDQDDAGHGRWASVYGRVLDALEDLLAGIDPATEHGGVPATPDWTVRQVVAHLAGTASDITTGRMAGAPGSVWTARQLAERDGVPVAELLAELRSTQRSFGVIAEGASAGVFNAVVHHADLTEALGAPRQDEALFLPVLQDQRHRWSTLSLRLPHDPDLAGLRPVDPYLLSRALFTRLDRSAVRALVGPNPTDAEVDGLGLFGPPAYR